MAAPVPLRRDYDAATLRRLARSSHDPGQVRRLLAPAAIHDGEPRSAAAEIGGVGLQTVRDWVLRFNDAGPAGLLTGKAPVPQSRLAEQHRAALRQIVDEGPIPAVHGVVRWRIIDLLHWLWDEFRVSLSKQTLSRELRALGFRKLSARPRHHAKNPDAAEVFKKLPRPAGAGRGARGCGQARRVWWQDEARVGQKNKITRRWARRGTRPAAPHDQRTRSAYLFGAICPAQGKGAALVLPRCTSEAMALHLEEISSAVAPGAHAVVLLDRAGWHTSAKLPIPGNITLLPGQASARPACRGWSSIDGGAGGSGFGLPDGQSPGAEAASVPD